MSATEKNELRLKCNISLFAVQTAVGDLLHKVLAPVKEIKNEDISYEGERNYYGI